MNLFGCYTTVLQTGPTLQLRRTPIIRTQNWVRKFSFLLINKSDLKDVYAICHLAGLSNDPMGDLNETLTYDINHKASVRLAKLAKEGGVEKFIFMASLIIHYFVMTSSMAYYIHGLILCFSHFS